MCALCEILELIMYIERILKCECNCEILRGRDRLGLGYKREAIDVTNDVNIFGRYRELNV